MRLYLGGTLQDSIAKNIPLLIQNKSGNSVGGKYFASDENFLTSPAEDAKWVLGVAVGVDVENSDISGGICFRAAPRRMIMRLI